MIEPSSRSRTGMHFLGLRSISGRPSGNSHVSKSISTSSTGTSVSYAVIRIASEDIGVDQYSFNDARSSDNDCAAIDDDSLSCATIGRASCREREGQLI